jgi:6-phosphogluconate dehydrogenase
MTATEIGLIGCGVMGCNLARNIAGKGYVVRLFDCDAARLTNCLEKAGTNDRLLTAGDVPALVTALPTPRIVMLMVPAGDPVDACINDLLPHLDAGDIIIDGGNSHFADTMRRCQHVESHGQLFVGTGVSGGEQGALLGPSIMPGGSPAAWERIRTIFQAIAARTADGTPCCDWIGPGGAGHFVKMIHNGIEYGDMQLICEAYHLLRYGAGLSLDELSDVFADWNRGMLNSYLIEITADILAHREADGTPTVDIILDSAGQKGTGKWTAHAALDAGQPLTLIGAAVFARFLSALKDERVAAAEKLRGPDPNFTTDRDAFVKQVEQTLYAAKIVSYAQGYQLMRAVAAEQRWPLDYGAIALLWRGGCIIRSAFLEDIKRAFGRDPHLVNLLLDPFFQEAVARAQPAWRQVVTTGVQLGIPLPALSAAIAYFDGYRCKSLPANLLQAQRDYFGAHTYQRVDRPSSAVFHTDWQSNRNGNDGSSGA